MVQLSLKPLGNLTAIYYYLGLSGKADTAAATLKQIVEHTDTLQNKYDSYYYLGVYNQQQKYYYGIALDNFIKSAELHKKVADTTSVMKVKLDYATKQMMIAEIYIFLKHPQKALEYLGYAGPYLHKSVIVDVGAYGKYIRAYALKGDRKNAQKYYDLLHEVTKGSSGRWSELVSSNLEIAGLELKAGQLKTAKTYIDRAYEQAKLDNTPILLSPVHFSYGDYYRESGDLTKALHHYQMAEEGSKAFNKEQYADLLKHKTDLSIRLGRVDDAKRYFDNYTLVSDSLNREKVSLNLAEMEARFQNRLKQNEISILNIENESKQQQLKEERKARGYLIGAAILALLVAAMVYRNFVIKKKANTLLDEKNRLLDILNLKLTQANEAKTRLFSIISHDLRGPIARLFSFLKLQQAPSDRLTPEKRQAYQETLVNSSSLLLRSLEDLLLWSKSQMDAFEMEEEELDLKEILEGQSLMLKDALEKKELTLVYDQLEWSLLNSDLNMVQTIVRNSLENALRNATPGTTIRVSTGHEANQRYLSFYNEAENLEGKDFSSLSHSGPSSKSSGYGLVIIRELAEKIGAALEIRLHEARFFELRLHFKD